MLRRFRCVQIFHKQYNVGEKTAVILCTLTLHLIAMQGHLQKAKTKQKQCSTSNMVVIIYCYIIGWKDKASTWYLNGFPDGSNLGSRV